jgi:glycosyltransferase involved in cell wall biosynthesis
MMPPEPASSLAIVMPVLNEAAGIEAALRALAPLRARGARVVVADGGSADDTPARARRFGGVEVIEAARGRAAQMNAGAQAASGARVLLFLHADTTLPPDADRLILQCAGRAAATSGAASTCASPGGPGCCAWWRPA